MADYPAGVYAPRTKANKSGVVYDAAKTTTLFVEDIQKTDAEVVAIETELGANPKGASATVKARLDANDTAVGLKAPIASPTFTGMVTIPTGADITKPALKGTDPTGAAYTPATGAQNVTINCAANNIHIVTGHADGTAITFLISNATNNQPFIISILQGAVVSTIVAWFATVRWAGGSAPTLTATVGKRDTFGFIRTGASTYDGFIIGQNA
jgi:hypothetical protein